MSTDSNELKSYDRQPQESDKSWAAFCVYRDMGIHRSLDKAYRAWKGLQDGSKRAARYFFQWSIDYDWVKRTSDYDADEQKRRQIEQRRAHEQQIIDYQSEALLLGKNAMLVAGTLVAACGTVGNDLVSAARKNKTLTREQIGIAATTASTLKNAIAAGDLAAKLRGDSLYINEIIALMQKIDGTGKPEGD